MRDGYRWVCLAVQVAAVGAVGACGDDFSDPFADLVQVSAATPFADGCEGRAQSGQVTPGAEVEPHLAVNPADARHLVAAWQQDRWSNGGARGLVTAVSRDGGETWRRARVRFSRCSGAADGDPGDYERATDPWLAFTADGDVVAVALALDKSSGRDAILAARSSDGGATWGAPVALTTDDDVDVFNDKVAVTADPRDPRRMYVVWNRLTGLTVQNNPRGTGPTWFARTNGEDWEAARPIYDPGLGAQTLGNQIVVLPDGTLVNGFTRILRNMKIELVVIRSTDQGASWSEPIVATSIYPMPYFYGDVPIRGGGGYLADLEVDASGALVFAWESQLSNISPIATMRSTDGGRTWSAPRPVGVTNVYAFTPVLAATRDGALGLLYYDLRDSPPDELDVTSWLATSYDGGQSWSEEPLAGPLDLRRAKLGETYFLGDYQGLVAAGAELVPLLSLPMPHGGPTAIFTRPLRR